jgi:glycerol-3-phosphate dehydrogenase subunit C
VAADARANVDPRDPEYVDEASVRDALTVAFDACYECRACTDLCEVFPRLFTLLDRVPGGDAGALTPAQQDHVVDACVHCGRCAHGCVATTDDGSNVDLPQLILRAVAMRRAVGQQPWSQQVATRVLARTHGTASAPIGGPPGSVRRRLLSKAAGISAVRVLPPRSRERFSTWFERRGDVVRGEPVERVTLVPTCQVEYHDTAIGRDAVQVYEDNGFACSVASIGCCGAPWLQAGELARFARIAEQNVDVLAAAVRRGNEVIVLQPTCREVIADRYPDHVRPESVDDARLVADAVLDVTDHLLELFRSGRIELTASSAHAPVTLHRSCPQQVRGSESIAELLGFAGRAVRVVDQCAGTGAMWGLRSPNEAVAVGMADRLVAAIVQADPEGLSEIVTDCSFAATAIAERGVRPATHPVSLLARSCGRESGPTTAQGDPRE